MAKTSSSTFVEPPKIVRKGVHAKSQTSSNKASKNYKKKYKGQGR
jgi:hypothetical protein